MRIILFSVFLITNLAVALSRNSLSNYIIVFIMILAAINYIDYSKRNSTFIYIGKNRAI